MAHAILNSCHSRYRSRKLPADIFEHFSLPFHYRINRVYVLSDICSHDGVHGGLELRELLFTLIQFHSDLIQLPLESHINLLREPMLHCKYVFLQ